MTAGWLVVLHEGLLEEMVDHARKDYPREACGIIVGDMAGEKYLAKEVLRAKNSSPTPSKNYDIDPLLVAQAHEYAEEQNLQVIGFYHSHPNHPPTPSPTDVKYAWPEMIYVIITITHTTPKTETRAWLLDPEKKGFQEIPLIKQ